MPLTAAAAALPVTVQPQPGWRPPLRQEATTAGGSIIRGRGPWHCGSAALAASGLLRLPATRRPLRFARKHASESRFTQGRDAANLKRDYLIATQLPVPGPSPTHHDEPDSASHGPTVPATVTVSKPRASLFCGHAGRSPHQPLAFAHSSCDKRSSRTHASPGSRSRLGTT
jgi:hypothetical protein